MPVRQVCSPAPRHSPGPEHWLFRPSLPQPQEATYAYSWQGTWVLPNGMDSGAGAGAPGGANSSAVFPGLVAVGEELVAAAGNVQPSVEACSAACWAEDACNVFTFCPEQVGREAGKRGTWQGPTVTAAAGDAAPPSVVAPRRSAHTRHAQLPPSGADQQYAARALQAGCTSLEYNLSSPFGGCQLVDQQPSRPGTGRPALLVESPGFLGGAPVPSIKENKAASWAAGTAAAS